MESPGPADPRRPEEHRRSGTRPEPGARNARTSGAGSAGRDRARTAGSAEEKKKTAADRLGSAGERLGSASKKLGTAGRKVGRASKVGASGFAAASVKTADITGRMGKATGRRIRGLTGAQGAGESGLSRLIELGAVNAAGDTAFAVSLAGTVFFAVPSSQARDRVALFLLLTMAPFALMAPLIGPILDRFRHGRRWAIGATLGLRGFLVWSLAASISHSSTWLYPAALGCLVASKAYGVTRASAVPRLLPKDVTLVTANSRISLAGLAGATIGAGIAGAFAAIGPQWSLRWAALVYTVGLVLAIRLPGRVDSPAGEELTGTAGRELRRKAITAAVARGIRCNLGLRFVSGFLTMYLAFLLRDRPISGINGTVAAGAVIAAAGIGNSLGTLTGSLLKARKPEGVVLVVLLADAIVAICVAVLYGFPILIALGLVAGLCSSLGKLSLDAMIQRDVPETVRTSVFARSETVLQLAWVLGGGAGIVLPLIPRLGFGFLAAVLVIVVILVLRSKPSTPGPATRPPRPGVPGGADGLAEHHETRPVRTPEHDPQATTRTILTSPDDPTVGSPARARSGHQARYDEPTVELRFDPFGDSDRPTSSERNDPRDKAPDAPDAPAGRWWSGQPDEDETVEDEAPWAADPTLERKPGPFRRHRSGPDTGTDRRPPR